jgi:hypothetical protein
MLDPWPALVSWFPASIFRKSIDQLLNFHRNDGWISMDFSDGYTFLSEIEPRHDLSSLSVDFWVILGSSSHIGGKFTSQLGKGKRPTRHHQSTPRKQLGIGSSDGSEANFEECKKLIEIISEMRTYMTGIFTVMNINEYLIDIIFIKYSIDIIKYSL